MFICLERLFISSILCCVFLVCWEVFFVIFLIVFVIFLIVVVVFLDVFVIFLDVLIIVFDRLKKFLINVLIFERIMFMFDVIFWMLLNFFDEISLL